MRRWIAKKNPWRHAKAIHPDAIREFLERPRDSHDWMKSLSGAALDGELRALGIDPAPPDQLPWDAHQKVCLLLGAAYPGFAFWLDMGLGKTRVAIRLIRYYMDKGLITTALVLARTDIAIVAWEDELRKWDPSMPRLCLYRSSSEEKWERIEAFHGGVIVGTYAAITRMLCEAVPKKKGHGNQLVMSDRLVRRLGRRINALVPDEATTLANMDSRITQLFYHLRKNCVCCWELAGVPFGRDPTMLWRQLYLVDKGETLGETMGLFRAAFFDHKDNYFGGREYKFKDDMDGELRRIVRHRSIAYDEGECRDLPDVLRRVAEVRLPDEATAYYQRFVAEIKRTRASFEVRRNAFVRMRQVASGYVGFVDDATGERAEIEFAVNPKLDRLMELVERIPEGRKFVIWYEFTHTGRLITAALREAGIKHQWLWGGTSHEARKIQDTFDHDDDDRGLLANHKVAAYSLNLQRANYEFVLEAPVSYIDDRQMRKRLPRKGQTRRVFSWDIVCVGTADSRILQFHQEGKDFFEAIIRDPEDTL